MTVVTTGGVLRVFVYGTLMPGQPRWPYLQPHTVGWEPARAPGRLWDTGRGYPAARFGEGDGEIPGVAVTVAAGQAEAVIRLLDEIEGEGLLYQRVEVTTNLGAAVSYQWLGATDDLVPLPDGWPGL